MIMHLSTVKQKGRGPGMDVIMGMFYSVVDTQFKLLQELLLAFSLSFFLPFVVIVPFSL